MGTINPEDENGLQSFFVLHKVASPTLQSSRKARKRINSCSTASLRPPDSYNEALRGLEQGLRLFHVVWSNIESTIKDALRNINCSVFDALFSWIHESFEYVNSRKLPDPSMATKCYPVMASLNHPASSEQLPTALVVTNNMEFVDDFQTFGDLAQHLKSRGYHAAKLTYSDFSLKSGVVGCLRSLLRQFLTVSTDAADISILASWYSEQGNHENPIVLIIDSVERCCRSVLSDIIIMLSEWVLKIPMILVLGISTTADAIRDLLPSNVLQHLSPSKFILESPAKRMDAIIDSLFLKHFSCFCLSHKVATFLRDHFLMQDGTLTEFIRALQIAGVLHFILDIPNSAGLVDDKCSHDFTAANVALLQERMIKQAFGLSAIRKDDELVPDDELWIHSLSELQRMYNEWSSFIQCLNEAGKYQKLTLLDLYCAVLDPLIHRCSKDDDQFQLAGSHTMTSSTCCFNGLHPCGKKCSPICLAIGSVRNISAMELYKLLNIWENHTAELGEFNKKIKELRSSMKFDNSDLSDAESKNISKKRKTQAYVHVRKCIDKVNGNATELAISMVREYCRPIECIPMHKIVCFNNSEELQSGLMGEPRKRVQVDLLESQKFLKCQCCMRKGNMPLPSVHDTSTVYSLSLEHGDLINVHDLFESFKARISQPDTRSKNRSKRSSKVTKTSEEPQRISDASIQARFCRAIIELQITGLLRTPSKRRPDFVQRIAFGI